jgi:hypothetical protein
VGVRAVNVRPVTGATALTMLVTSETRADAISGFTAPRIAAAFATKCEKCAGRSARAKMLSRREAAVGPWNLSNDRIAGFSSIARTPFRVVVAGADQSRLLPQLRLSDASAYCSGQPALSLIGPRGSWKARCSSCPVSTAFETLRDFWSLKFRGRPEVRSLVAIACYDTRAGPTTAALERSGRSFIWDPSVIHRLADHPSSRPPRRRRCRRRGSPRGIAPSHRRSRGPGEDPGARSG